MNQTVKEKINTILSNCITEQEIPQSLIDSFPDIKISTRSHPGLQFFISKDKLTNNSTINNKGSLISIRDISNNIGIGKIKYDSTLIEKKVFVKTIHLLDPYLELKNYYVDNDIRTEKINRINNQAYIDCITASILSKLKEESLLNHCLETYGSFCGIKDKYRYNITDDFVSLRNKNWFWDMVGICGEKLIIKADDCDDYTIIEQLKTAPKSIFKSQHINTSFKSIDSISSLKSNILDLSENHIISSTNIDIIELESCDSLSIMSDDTININKAKDAVTCDEDTNYDDLLYDNNIELFIEFENMPVIVLFIEAADGILSDLIDEEYEKECNIYEKYGLVDGSDGSKSCEEDAVGDSESLEADSCECDSNNRRSLPIPATKWQGDSESLEADSCDCDCDGHLDDDISSEEDEEFLADISALQYMRDEKWAAWLFQIIAILTQYQAIFQLCHNDLHSSNVVWKNTKEEYIYYKSNNGNLWKVPTYGKVFYIIDYGRATFRFNDIDFYSDDYMVGGDAHTQYNYSSIYNSELPEVKPNMSFDLCRLATCMIFDIFLETPTAKSDKIMYKEGDWVKNITISDIYNKLWTWLLDSSGVNVFTTQDGEEKYNGFDLYVKIAEKAVNAEPRKQLVMSPFNNFITKSKKLKPSTKINTLFI